MILSLTSDAVPRVRVVLTGAELASGQPWEVRASYDEAGRTLSYRPRGGSGVGAGAQVVLIDAAAPIRTPITYTLYRSQVAVGSADITRTSPAGDVVTDLRGSTYAIIRRTAGRGFPQTPDLRASFAEVPGSRLMPARLAPVAGVGMAAFEAVTDISGTWALRDLIATNAPLYLLHDCDMPYCDVPRAELAILTGIPSDRRDAGQPERVWAVSYRPTADPEPDLIAALSTWAQHDAPLTGKTWAQHDALIAGMTWGQHDLIDWDTLG